MKKLKNTIRELFARIILVCLEDDRQRHLENANFGKEGFVHSSNFSCYAKDLETNFYLFFVCPVVAEQLSN